MKKRIRLISKGEVQKVGYRDAVKDIAAKSGVTGYVENMRNSDVQIVCELDEELIPKFVEAIKIKKDFINVEDVKIVEKSKATGEFEYFDIKYGRLEEEFGDRAGPMILHLGGIQSSINKVGEKVDNVGKDVRVVGEKTDILREDTRENFNRMDKKYDVIFKTMATMNENLLAGQKQFTILNKNLANTQEQLTKVVDKLTVIVDRFIENEKNKSKNDKKR